MLAAGEAQIKHLVCPRYSKSKNLLLWFNITQKITGFYACVLKLPYLITKKNPP